MKATILSISIIVIITLASCSKDHKRKCTVTFYTTWEGYIPADINIDGQTVRLEAVQEEKPVNCNASNTTATVKVSEGSHEVTWSCGNGLSGSEVIDVINDCFIFEVGR